MLHLGCSLEQQTRAQCFRFCIDLHKKAKLLKASFVILFKSLILHFAIPEKSSTYFQERNREYFMSNMDNACF